ncbi:MAG: type II toxin-antitoxin system prevent-host-death family antitoxin [Neoaquamicrobium sediminum]|uniref:type II toxin-antitoxin system prevent-host-death family antitoxin n=1 Tax=Neoaquamicrobium sediminum TaxID=1849104 RepID=UPI0040369BCD
MKRFTFSDMNRSSGEILEAAMLEPVVLTKHGKEKLVIVSARDYHRMRGEPSRRSHISCMKPLTMSMWS